MADKEQIMINSVDVSECLFYQSNFEEDYDVKIKHFCSNWHNSCESINNSNCYFKQLARKTQELYFARNEVHSKTEYIREQRDIIDKLKQEYEQLQEKYEALKLENQEGYEIVAELNHECEELKKDLQDYESWFDEYKILFTYDGRTPVTNDELYTCLEELVKKGNDETNRYHKALEEIEKVINNIFDSCLGHKTDGCTPVHNVCEELIKILDIINKAKGQ